MGFGAPLIHSFICSTVFLGPWACQALLQQETDYEQGSRGPCPVGPSGLAGYMHMNINCHGIRRHEGECQGEALSVTMTLAGRCVLSLGFLIWKMGMAELPTSWSCESTCVKCSPRARPGRVSGYHTYSYLSG